MLHAQLENMILARMLTACINVRGNVLLQICAVCLQQATKPSDAIFFTYLSYSVPSPSETERGKGV
jgi:hypothetical protein